MKKTVSTSLLLIFTLITVWSQSGNMGQFTDPRDGQSYITVKIGNQVWLAQNLNYATENESWTLPGDPSGNEFGRFYTWEAAKTAVPQGWHLPCKEELEILAGQLGISELPNEDDLYPLLMDGGKSGLNMMLLGSHNEGYGKKGKFAAYWSSDENWLSVLNPFMEFPWCLVLRYPNYVNIGNGAESSEGFNVRCIKD